MCWCTIEFLSRFYRCPLISDTVRKSDRYGVRCCSEEQFIEAKKRDGCPWAASRDANRQCNTSATYDEAVARCALQGARLCTRDELLQKCAKTTGCGLNKVLVWSMPNPTPAPIGTNLFFTPAPTLSPVTSPACTEIENPKTCREAEGCNWFEGFCDVQCSIDACSQCTKNGNGDCTDVGCLWSKGKCVDP